MLSTLLTIARFTSIEVLRGRLLVVLAVALLLALGTAWFVAGLAITEAGDYRAAVLAAVLRGAAVAIIALFTTAGMVRDYQEKTLELVLAGAVTRAQYFLGRLAGFTLIAALVAIAAGVAMFAVSPGTTALIWAAQLLLELALVTAACMTAVVTFRQLPLALAAVGVFYLAARSVAALELVSRSPLIDRGDGLHTLFAGAIQALAYLLPELSRFATSGMFLDAGGTWFSMPALVLETLIYAALLCVVGLTDFYRQNL
ncbi:MAG: ABC transporter permease [Gammaproteobacteria bacterium]|nr:ABC transporter permease [Gammaproteobacteria bacterium]